MGACCTAEAGSPREEALYSLQGEGAWMPLGVLSTALGYTSLSVISPRLVELQFPAPVAVAFLTRQLGAGL